MNQHQQLLAQQSVASGCLGCVAVCILEVVVLGLLA